MHRIVLVALTLIMALALVPFLGTNISQAQPTYASEAFEAVRDRLDRPIEEGQVSRTWFWGPEPISNGVNEPYIESPGGQRLVQYIDKARFELTHPDGDPDDPWFVSTGLLTRELISGSVQVGEASYEQHAPSTASMAGDATNTWPTYAGFERVIDQLYADMTGQPATNVLLSAGVTSYPEAADDPNTEIVEYITYEGPNGPVGYNIPAAFLDFMTAPGVVWTGEEYVQQEPLMEWLFVMGFPISDPFWVTVQLDGEPTWVMLQAFERRVLTYTPTNAEGWQVEMGNVGRHYFEWRYDGGPPQEPEPPEPSPTPTPPPATVTPIPTPTVVPGGDGPSSDRFAMRPGNRWTYQDQETGELYEVYIPGRSADFIEGESLLIRQETRPDGSVQRSYWKTTETVLWLYGLEELTPDGEHDTRVVYDPPIRYLTTNLDLGEGWGTNSRIVVDDIPLELFQFSFEVILKHQINVLAGTFITSYIQATEALTDGDDLVGPVEIVRRFEFAPNYGIIVDEREDDLVLELVAYSLQ